MRQVVVGGAVGLLASHVLYAVLGWLLVGLGLAGAGVWRDVVGDVAVCSVARHTA